MPRYTAILSIPVTLEVPEGVDPREAFEAAQRYHKSRGNHIVMTAFPPTLPDAVTYSAEPGAGTIGDVKLPPPPPKYRPRDVVLVEGDPATVTQIHEHVNGEWLYEIQDHGNGRLYGYYEHEMEPSSVLSLRPDAEADR